MFYSKIICSIIPLEMQGAWFIQNFSKLPIQYPRVWKYTQRKGIRDAFQTLNSMKSEVWNLRQRVLDKASFLFPRIQTWPSGLCMAGERGTLVKPKLLLCNNPPITLNSLILRFSWPLLPPPHLETVWSVFFTLGLPKRSACLWTMEIRLLMFNCVLMHGYLPTWHISSPS